jgi:hypothetical protein
MEQRLRLVQGGHQPRSERRTFERRNLAVPGQIVWKDARGNTKLLDVTTKNVSERGVVVECQTGAIIPLYRLVYFQVAREARHTPNLPAALKKPNVLSAIFRVGAGDRATGAPCEYALRLLIEPVRAAQSAAPETVWNARGQQPLTAAV